MNSMKNDDKARMIEDQIASLQSELSQLVDQGSEGAKQAADGYIDMLAQAAKQYLSDATGSVREKTAATGKLAKKTLSDADGYAREHPWHAAAVGGIAGFALGYLISRRGRNE